MANIHVGFLDQRSCNRILKPPGGGTSNIFGTDAVPDIIPQNHSVREKHAGSIKQVLQTESVTTVTRKEENRRTSNGNTTLETISKEEQNGSVQSDAASNGKLQEENQQNEELNNQNGVAPDITCDISTKVEEITIEEKSTKTEVSTTDGSENTDVILNKSTSEGSVERNNYKGSSIGNILKEEDILEKRKSKGQNQRVPPGGYSSGLW